LPCRINNLEEHYTVSWIRAADVTVLSVGHVTFSSDQRFSVIQVPRPSLSASDWTLVINNVTKEDAGVYECQVNTDPKINRKHYLTVGGPPQQKDSPYNYPVVEPSVEYQKTHSVIKKHHKKEEIETDQGFSMFLHESGCLCPKPAIKKLEQYSHEGFRREPTLSIIGMVVQYVSHGSGFGLECLLSNTEHVPGKMFWRKDNEVVTAKQRPGISLETEKLPDSSRSHLYVAKAHLKDSGNYTCVSDGSNSASVLLVVTPGSNFHLKSLLGAEVVNYAISMKPVEGGCWLHVLLLLLCPILLHH